MEKINFKDILEKIKKIDKKTIIITVSLIGAIVIILIALFCIKKYNERPKLNPYIGPATPTITKTADGNIYINGVLSNETDTITPKTEQVKEPTKTTTEKVIKKKK